MSSPQKRKKIARITCPKCGATMPKSVLLCDCGYHFQTKEMVLVGDGPSVSRDEHLIRVTQGAPLPDYCVLCGQDSAHRIHRIFYWNRHGIPLRWYGPGSSLLTVALSKKTAIEIPICGACFAARRGKLWLGASLLVCATAVGLIINEVRPANSALGMALAALLLVVGLMFIVRNSAILSGVERDDDHNAVTFAGASSNFLRRLPRS